MTVVRSIFFVMLLSFGVSAQTMTVGGVELPRQKGDFELSGAGLLRKGFFFKIYVGALYIDRSGNRSGALNDIPKRIDIHYFHHTPKKHMIRVANETLRKNLPPHEYEQLLPGIEKLHQAFLNGRKGSHASIVHRPGEGLTYLFDEEYIVTIDSDRFANAYFSIWLGKHPSSQTVKQAMLEGAKR